MTCDPDLPSADGDEDLTRKIIARARNEIKVRDLLSFMLARIWSVVLVLGAVLFAATQSRRR